MFKKKNNTKVTPAKPEITEEPQEQRPETLTPNMQELKNALERFPNKFTIDKVTDSLDGTVKLVVKTKVDKYDWPEVVAVTHEVQPTQLDNQIPRLVQKIYAYAKSKGWTQKREPLQL